MSIKMRLMKEIKRKRRVREEDGGVDKDMERERRRRW
jgi:hypothetical protein